MFNAIDFYPTPSHVARKMIEPYIASIEANELSMLEPSAGKGDLVKAAMEAIRLGVDYKHRHKVKYYAIEQDPELTAILRQIKDLKIIGDDFLSYSGYYYFNLILMNPPFSKGASHLLRAWELLEEGDIACLLNAETINNPYTQERKTLARIIEKNGTVEMLGNCFSDAQRKTNVNVALVRLHKKAEGKSAFDFDKIGMTYDGQPYKLDFEVDNVAVANRDKIGNMELCFSALSDALKEVAASLAKAHYYAKAIDFDVDKFLSNSYSKHAMDTSNPKYFYGSTLEAANRAAWSSIISQSDFSSRLTSDFKTQFYQHIDHQKNISFSKANVVALLSAMIQNAGDIMQNCIESLFDRLTKYSDKNKDGKGFKTNSHYKLNRRFIMPQCGRTSTYAGTQVFETYYHRDFYDWANDLDIACCNLAGIRIEDISSVEYKDQGKVDMRLANRVDNHVRTVGFSHQICDTYFFEAKVFKNGNVHLYFKDEELWHKFNQVACKNKNWLTDETEKKRNKNK